MSKYLNASYTERGFKNRLLSFYRYKFRSIELNGIKFIGNKAYNYTGAGLRSQRPRFFNFSQDDFQSWPPSKSLLLRNIEISRNIFTNTDCMVHLVKHNMTYGKFKIEGNGL